MIINRKIIVILLVHWGMLANSQSEEILPVFNNCVKITFRIGASSEEQCLSTRGWIPSRPGDLLVAKACEF